MTQKQTALITGASMGLGREFAHLFAKDGHNVVLVARSLDKLEAVATEVRDLYGVEAHVITADLADPAAPNALHSEVEAKGLQVDYLVNNAGFGTTGSFAESTLESQLNMLQVNINAVVALTHLFLRGMIARGAGKVLNIASTAGFQPGPKMSVYYASKSFVILFTEGLVGELKGTGVTATAHCPGATATNFAETAGNAKSLLFKLAVAKPDRVARHAYRSMMAGRAVAIDGLLNWLAAFSIRFSPRAVVRALTGWLNSTD